MSDELVKASPVGVPAIVASASLPLMVEGAGGTARFAWEEFFYPEQHNPHTQRAYERAVRRFLGWCEGQGVELASITPGMVGQYVVSMGGSPAKRNQRLAALRGFFDRLVNWHVCIRNPALSLRGVKDQVIEGKTPEEGRATVGKSGRVLVAEGSKHATTPTAVHGAANDGRSGGLRDRVRRVARSFKAGPGLNRPPA